MVKVSVSSVAGKKRVPFVVGASKWARSETYLEKGTRMYEFLPDQGLS